MSPASKVLPIVAEEGAAVVVTVSMQREPVLTVSPPAICREATPVFIKYTEHVRGYLCTE